MDIASRITTPLLKVRRTGDKTRSWKDKPPNEQTITAQELNEQATTRWCRTNDNDKQTGILKIKQKERYLQNVTAKRKRHQMCHNRQQNSKKWKDKQRRAKHYRSMKRPRCESNRTTTTKYVFKTHSFKQQTNYGVDSYRHKSKSTAAWEHYGNTNKHKKPANKKPQTTSDYVIKTHKLTTKKRKCTKLRNAQQIMGKQVQTNKVFPYETRVDSKTARD